MAIAFTGTARRVGVVSAVATAGLIVAYAATLIIGLISLPSPDAQIGDPMFTILEVLILGLTPAMVALMVALHAWVPERLRSLSLVAVIFMGLLAGVTSSVHFLVLTLSREARIAGQEWAPLFLSFTWPSVAYALDILAWDVFFPFAMFFAGPAVTGSRLADWTRRLMITSGSLSLAGLSGVILGDMQLRNIGILGYVGVFPLVAIMLGLLFQRTVPRGVRGDMAPGTEATMDVAKLKEFGTKYTAAWCSQNAAGVAALFAESGSLTINDGASSVGRTAISAAAQSFMTAFPDIVVTMDSVSLDGGRAVYRWTLTGTNTGPGGTGKAVRISGYEEWTFGADGLIAESKGHFDEAEYDRQLGK
jgi:uncharacterized protein (TIGR02246 family)